MPRPREVWLRRVGLLVGVAALLAVLRLAAPDPPPAARLIGRAVLPAETFAGGPASGRRLPPLLHGVQTPFPAQPLQGISALAALDGGRYLALVDNGYGTLETSADFRLRVYELALPELERGRGRVEVLGHVDLCDPDGHVSWPIVETWTPGRPLTGADFDPESLQVAPDGTLWIGDEFGPFLLHFDRAGRLLAPPLELPDPETSGPLRSPQSPLLEEGCAVRVLMALDAHRRQHGGARPPVCSVSHELLADGDPRTGVETRLAARGGVPAASSELFELAALHAAGFEVVPWTVNDPARMSALLRLGVDGLISDSPDLLLEAVQAFDADGDGAPGDLLGPDGLIDPARFDAQGHRGARDLRPENTLPAFEAALDALVTTLETDCGLTRDGVPVISHDERLSRHKVRRRDGRPYGPADELLVREVDLRTLQDELLADMLLAGRPRQTNDRAASPVAVAWARELGLPDPYVLPSLAQALGLPRFYAEYYRTGPGRAHPQAALRARNAERVRWNVETKLNPRGDQDERGRVRRELTVDAPTLTRAVLDVIARAGLIERTTLQSFDARSLLEAHRVQPGVGTSLLVGDFPVLPEDPHGPGSDDGTNLQGEGAANTPWLAGLRWPYRVTRQDHPVRVRRSGGLEGLARSPDGARLYPLLEQPLADAPRRELLLFELDLASREFLGPPRRYPLSPRATAVGCFQLLDARRGVVVERDDTQGDLQGWKRVFELELGPPGELVTKRELCDLLRLADPGGIAPPVAGDVGLGPVFAFPFLTIETVLPMGPGRFLLANDDNFPFSVGRHLGSDRPDDTELIVIELGSTRGD